MTRLLALIRTHVLLFILGIQLRDVSRFPCICLVLSELLGNADAFWQIQSSVLYMYYLVTTL